MKGSFVLKDNRMLLLLLLLVSPHSGQVPPSSGQVPPSSGQVPPSSGQVPPKSGQVLRKWSPTHDQCREICREGEGGLMSENFGAVICYTKYCLDTSVFQSTARRFHKILSNIVFSQFLEKDHIFFKHFKLLTLGKPRKTLVADSPPQRTKKNLADLGGTPLPP